MKNELNVHTRSISRRSFLITAGTVGIAVSYGNLPSQAFAATIATETAGNYNPNAWVTINHDGTVTIISPASEMGQGVMTTLPLLIADEMDAEWSKVKVVQSPSDAEKYGNPGFYGIQLTGGSETVRGYYEPLRLVGGQTRMILLHSAAEILDKPVTELTTEPGVVVHTPTQTRISYGEISRLGKIPDPLPQITAADLKQPDQWHYIGKKDLPRIDVPSKVDGSAIYGIDVQLPDMLYGAVIRPPVQGETPANIDDSEAKNVPGITKIVQLPYGVGIIGETIEATIRAKEMLSIEWTTGSRIRNYSSASLIEEYRKAGSDLSQTGVHAVKKGEAAQAIASSDTLIEVDYLSDHVYHATMEPMNATALVSDDGVDVWAPTQGPTFTQGFAAQTAGTTTDKVRVHTTMLGGGFGRRAERDFVDDAVSLAKEVKGRPVKAVWSREDDVRHGKYRPLVAQHVRVGLTSSGAISGWQHRVAADSIFARTLPPVFEDAGGLDDVVTEGADFNYDMPTHEVEYLRQDNGLDIGYWRAVGCGYTKFAVECVVDEIAAARNIDPAQQRLELLAGEPRARKVIENTVKMSDWSRPREGRALGLAYSDSFGAHCAAVAEVSVNRENGQIRVHKVWTTVDPGVAIQPQNIEAQMTGAITHGISHALYEQINVVNGEVQEGNFDTYRVIRMSEIPEIEVSILGDPTQKPSGMGEVGLPPIGPAIANAFARLTDGARLRHYPFLPDRVLEALNG